MKSTSENGFVLLAEIDPPKGTDLSGFVGTAEEIRESISAVVVPDGSQAIMRMTPLAPCRALAERGIATVMALNGRDRNRISFQGDLLAAWAMGVRDVLATEGQDPATGDQPLAKAGADLDIDVMLQCLSALRAGRDLGGNAIDGRCDFAVGVGVQVTDDPESNRAAAARFGRLADSGVGYVVTSPTYDLGVIEQFESAARTAGLRLFPSVILLKSVAMIRYLNGIPGFPDIPAECLRRMIKAPDKTAEGMALARDLLGGIKSACPGAVLAALGWEGRLAQFLRTAES